MTIKLLTKKIINKIKNFPLEARQSQGDSGPSTSWDEYKEQIQYGEYDSFEVFQETIESMVEDDVNDLSEEELDRLYTTLYENYHTEDIEEKRRDIISCIIDEIREIAESEEIQYNKPSIEFIRYEEDDIIIIAKVLKQTGPEDYLVHAYSEITGGLGEQGIVNLDELEYYNGMEIISKPEFEKEIIKIKRTI
jgi:hypothetical protein